jgi:thiol-disulfide isomerase/thioredoxin
VRDEAQLNDADQAARQAFAATLNRAADLLGQATPPSMAVRTSLETRRFGRDSTSEPVLTAVSRSLPAPPLRLTDIDGANFSLDAYRGQVVLVNFWASWCRPCVAEIPSLHRLDATLKHTDFNIVTVNVGEDRARVNRFLRQVPVELPVLMDYDGAISKDWMIYVYPSSYLVDRQGKIRYAYLGALQWDSTEIIGIIRNLLSKR